LEPELYISSYRPVVFFPDFPGTLPNFLFVGLSQSAGSQFQLLRQTQDALHGFPIAHPPGKFAVLIGLFYQAAASGNEPI
jgi:hypothetical protein